MLEYSKYKSFLHDKSNNLIINRFFTSFGIALFSVVPSLYLSELGLSDGQIGIVTSLMVLFIILITGFQTILYEKFDEVKIFLSTFIIYSIILLGLILVKGLYVFIIGLFFILIMDNLRSNIFSILFRDVTKKKEFTRKESIMYAILNIGWFAGPFMGGILLENYGYNFIFTTIILFMLCAFISGLLAKIRVKKNFDGRKDYNILSNIKGFYHNKDFVNSYIVSFSSNFWYSLIFAFMPLFIVANGFGASYVGFFIAATQLPLVFIQLRLDYFIKKFGSRKLVTTSYFVLTIVMLLMFLFPSVYLAFILFTFSAIFLGFLEPTREILFFKYAKSNEEEKYAPIYRSSFDISRLLGRFSIGIVLLVLPFKFAFLLVGIVMFLTFLRTFSIKNFYN